MSHMKGKENGRSATWLMKVRMIFIWAKYLGRFLKLKFLGMQIWL